MLQNDEIFDFEDKLKKINALSLTDADEALKLMFDEKRKAVSLVGNADKKLSF